MTRPRAPGHARERPDWLAGHVGLELGNVGASHSFEKRLRYLKNLHSAHAEFASRDYSRFRQPVPTPGPRSAGLFFGHFAVRIRSPRQIGQPGRNAARTSGCVSAAPQLKGERSLLASLGQVGGKLPRHLKYIAHTWPAHAFLSSSLTTPARPVPSLRPMYISATHVQSARTSAIFPIVG